VESEQATKGFRTTRRAVAIAAKTRSIKPMVRVAGKTIPPATDQTAPGLSARFASQALLQK
jgi:hypothetical protein